MFAGIFAVFAALIGAIGVNRAANLQVNAAFATAKYEEEKKRKAGALVLASDLFAVRTRLVLPQNALKKRSEANWNPIEVPIYLNDFEVLSTQPADILEEIGIIRGDIGRINAIAAGPISTKPEQVEGALRIFEEFKNDCISTEKKLKEIATKTS